MSALYFKVLHSMPANSGEPPWVSASAAPQLCPLRALVSSARLKHPKVSDSGPCPPLPEAIGQVTSTP